MAQDNFTILELISQSPTTSVYKAHQNILDRTVLLKVLHRHLLRDKELVARFSREAKACAILKSENIVQVYDLTEVEGAPAIVMEYVEGKSLEDMLQNKEVRSEELLKRVAAAVLKALSYAHDRGVVHRDIKPGNILVSENGTIKVTDFGLAAVSDAPSLTMEGSLIGTPAYMSPEQARGETVDQRTDLFSLGVTLVEVLTGEKILVGRSYAECISKIQAFDTASINHIAPQCSPHIFEFLKRLLAPDKHNRFASAKEALAYFEGEQKELPRAADAQAESVKSRKRIVVPIAIAIIVIVWLLFAVRQPAKKASTAVSDSMTSSNDTPAAVRPSAKHTPEEPTVKSPSKPAQKVHERVMSKKEISSPASDTAEVAVRTDINTADLSPDSGYVAIHCTPWAKIFIDNEYAGTTPISGSIKIPVGNHTVTFNNPNFAPIVRQVDIRKNNLSDVDANFLKDSGYLLVSVEPWGNVYVDDQFRETTPSAQPIIVTAGTRRIRIHNPAFQDIVKTLNVKAGDTLRLNFSFFADKGDK